MPADYKFPVGVDLKFNKADPLLAQAREMALAKGLSQSDFSDFLGLYMATKVGEHVGKEAFKADQIKALGANGTARVDNVTTAIASLDGSVDKADAAAIADGIQTARQVEAWERIIARLSSQGSASFSARHRVPADDKAIPGYENMSFEQRRFAQDQRAAQRRTA